MSFENLIIPDNVVRDAGDSLEGAAGTKKYDPFQLQQAVGLDFYIHNTGSASLTVSRDGQQIQTIAINGVYAFDSWKFGFVTIIATDVYQGQWAGIRVETLKRRGLL